MQASPSHLSLNDKDVFLKELRTVTGPAHKRLEELPLSKAIVDPAITLQQYALYLSKMQAFVASFEEDLFPVLKNIFPDVETRRKAAWLRNDLAVLSGKGISLPQIPRFHFQSNRSLPFLAGALYVIEGSTLGGKFIYRNIHAALSLDAAHGAMYFNGYGADTGPKWSGFLEQLCNYAITQDRQEVYKGADETFKLLFDLLSE